MCSLSDIIIHLNDILRGVFFDEFDVFASLDQQIEKHLFYPLEYKARIDVIPFEDEGFPVIGIYQPFLIIGLPPRPFP